MTTHHEPVEPGSVDPRGPMAGASPSWSTRRGVGQAARALVGLLLAGVAVALLTSCGPPPPPCATNWVGPSGGDFNVASSWDTGSVPGPATVACAPAGSSIVVSDPRSVANAQLAGSVTITTTGSLSIDQSPSNIGVLTLQGNLTGNAAVTVGQLDWSAGRMLGAGTTTVVGPATVTNAVGTPKLANTRNLNLAGSTSWAASVARMCDTAQLTVSGPVTLTAPSALLSDAGCGATAAAHLVITPPGTLTLTSPTTIVAPTVNGGTVRIDPAATASFIGGFSQAQGTLDLAATDAIARIGNGGGTLSASGGTITGTGRIEGTVAGGATLAPGPTSGTPIGTLTITGAYSPGPGGRLALDLAGPTPGTQADRVLVGQDAAIAGTTIAVTYAAGFTPTPGQTFTPLSTTGILTGPVAGISTTGGGGSGLHALYAAHSLSLAVDQCDPATFHPGADLMDADLTAKDLRGCALARADLGSAHAPGSDLTDADLRNTSLIATDLTGADLTGADLTGALTSATTLTGAVFADTTCPDGTNSDAHGGTCAANLLSAIFTVNAGIDAVDADPGDHVCQTTTPGQCTLRAAIQEANASPGVDRVQFLPAITAVTLSVAGSDDTGAAGDLDVTTSMALKGPVTISGAGIDRILDVGADASVKVDLLFAAGPTTEGGIRNRGNLWAITATETTGGPGLVNVGNLEITTTGLLADGHPGLDNAGATVTRGAPAARSYLGGAPAVRNTGSLTGHDLYVSANAVPNAIGLDNHGTASLTDSTLIVSDPSAIVVDNHATLTLNRSFLTGGATSIRTSGTLHASDVTTTTTSPTGTRIDTSGDTHLDKVTTTGGTTGVRSTGPLEATGSSFSGAADAGIDASGDTHLNAVITAGGTTGVRSTGPLEVTGSSFSGAADAGIDASGPTSIVGTTLDGNGVGLRTTATATIDRTTISTSRTTGPGSGGLVATGALADVTVTSSTIAENAADGISISGGSALVSSSSVAANGGHAVAVTGAALTTSASVLAAPAGTAVCTGPVGSTGWNLAADDSCALVAPTDLQSRPVGLGHLGANGGPTRTLLPLLGSPAIDSGPPTCTATDQRGTARPLDGDADSVSVCDRGAVEVQTYHPLSLTVTSTGDADDAAPGDGVCATGPPADCTLRAAVTEANASFGPDTVTLPASQLFGAGPGAPLPVVRSPLVLHANSSGIVGQGGRTLEVSGPVEVTVDGLDGHDRTADNSLAVTDGDSYATLTNSVTRGPISNAGHLTLDRVNGIGTAVSTTGTTTIGRSSLVALVTGPGATTAVVRSTVNGSTGTAPQGTGVVNHGTTALRDATVTGHHTGIENTAGTVSLRNTVIDELDVGGVACRGPISSGDWNLSSDGTCGLTGPHDLEGTPAILGGIPAGAPVWFAAPQPGSAAIDAGDPACTTPDARGTAGPIDGDGDSVARCDRGAVEVRTPGAAAFTVDTTADTSDAEPGDGLCADASGACSLRAATDEATMVNGPSTIDLAPAATYQLADSPSGDRYRTLGPLRPSSPVTIRGHGSTLRRATTASVVVQPGPASADIDHLAIAGGVDATRGELLLDAVSAENVWTAASLDVSASTFTVGITVLSSGAATVDRTTSPTILNQGELHLTRSSTKVTTDGVGASTMVQDSTLGTTENLHGTTTITDSTVLGYLAAPQGQITVSGSILNPTIGSACSGTVTSGGWNLVSDASCAFAGPGDLTGTDPQLAPPATLGPGNTVRRPFPGSPAVDSGRPGCSGTDQTGAVRPADGNGDGTAACDRGAIELEPVTSLTLAVNATVDAPDATPGDHVCETATPGQCTLRAAVMEADATNGADTIELQPAATYPIAFVATDDDDPAAGDLDITSPITLHGHGATLDLATSVGLDIFGPLTVSIDQVLITGVGTGVRSPAATLTVSSSEVRGSVGLSTGGTLVASAFRCSCNTGIKNTGTATLTYADISASDALVNGGSMTITRSTATSEPFGAGRSYRATAPSATLALYQSTMVDGAVDLVGSTATITNTTIRAFGTALTTGGGSATVTNSILATYSDGIALPGNGSACIGTVASGGWNLVSDSTCHLTGTGDLVSPVVKLLPLDAYGGPTRTMPPGGGSPAIDSGKPGCAGIDQRGRPRPVDGDGNGSALCDRGAVEVDAPQPLALTVTTTADGGDAAPGDGVCQTAVPGQCTLRAALEESSHRTGTDSIALPAGATFTFTAASTRLPVHSDVTIVGNGATLDGTLTNPVLGVSSSAEATLQDLTITRAGDEGQAVGLLIPYGADVTLLRTMMTATKSDGIWNWGHLTVTDARFVDNVSLFRRVLYNMGTVDITGSTFDHNGGTIENRGQLNLTGSTLSRGGASPTLIAGFGSTTTMRRSTVSGNAFGVNVSGGANMWIYDSTITANASTGLVATGFVAVQNSIIANPTSGPNCSGAGILTGGYNLSSDATCRFTAATDLANTNADLGALAANGGLTATHLPNAGSAAVDSGNPSCGPVDQRGVNRPHGAGCDRGAVER